MKVFVSWSGELSKQLAQVLRTWLPSTIQSVRPYFSPSDIEKGAKWDNEISKELEETAFGLIAMTREALKSHWVTFEAGALSKQVDKSRICPICFDLEPTDIQGPLSRFQGIRFNKEEMYQLLTAINNAEGKEALTETSLRDAFNMWWPRLEKDVQDILSKDRKAAKPENIRTDRELIEETLLVLRNMQRGLDRSETSVWRDWLLYNRLTHADIKPANIFYGGGEAIPAATTLLTFIDQEGLTDMKVKMILKLLTTQFGLATQMARNATELTVGVPGDININDIELPLTLRNLEIVPMRPFRGT
jgi:hypothetical protein